MIACMLRFRPTPEINTAIEINELEKGDSHVIRIYTAYSDYRSKPATQT
jgi:hypothetical protein